MMFTLCVTSTFAAESWREAFVTRLMKIMSSDPSYNQVVLTDLDRNGIPEAFVMRGRYGRRYFSRIHYERQYNFKY